MDSFDKNDPENMNYHYNREERLSQLPAGVRERLYGKRRKFYFDRRSLLLLVSIILIGAAMGGVNFYQKKNQGKADFQGQKVELMALLYDNRVLASLKIEAVEDRTEGSIVEAEFFFFPEASSTVADLLPVRTGDIRYLRTELSPPDDLSVSLKVRLRIDEEELLLERLPQGEGP